MMEYWNCCRDEDEKIFHRRERKERKGYRLWANRGLKPKAARARLLPVRRNPQEIIGRTCFAGRIPGAGCSSLFAPFPKVTLKKAAPSATRIALLLIACLLPACKSHGPTQYISPRIEGRVLDFQTHQPIADVRVVRPDFGPRPTSSPPKGAEQLAQAPDVRTAADGTFALDSIRDFAVFRKVHWFAVSVSFIHPDYATFNTNFSAVLATNTAGGEPVIRSGDILLKSR